MEILTVRTCLGDERLVHTTWPDGSFSCPFCFSAVRAGEPVCPNPWCDASPYYAPERLQAERDKRAAREREETARRENHAAAMRRIVEDRASREAWETEQVIEARRRGACVRCLFGASRGVRFIKHRGACPRDRHAGRTA